MKNIVITGGELNNKGAQAMTFIAVDEIKKRYPSANIFLAAGTGREDDKIKAEPYRFEIVDAAMMDLKGLACRNRIWKFILGVRYGKDIYRPELCSILQNMDIMIDISGYAIGKDWGIKNSLLTAFRGNLAKAFGAKVYYMPQSFGVCNFGGAKEKIVKRILKMWLGCADVVYAREREGYVYLTQELGLRNVRRSYDLVLQNKGVSLTNIYHRIPCMREYVIEKKSVGIVPNMKIKKYRNQEQILALYKQVVAELLKEQYMVYLIYHSKEDLSLCSDIKSCFETDVKVQIIREELSYVEYCGIVRQLDFIVASRYHSVVNAYREGVPCIVWGWAAKYRELLQLFDQERYVCSVRTENEDVRIVDMLHDMIDKREQNAGMICRKLKEIQTENVFDILGRMN